MTLNTTMAPSHEIAASLLAEFEQELGTTRKFLHACPKSGSPGGRTRSR